VMSTHWPYSCVVDIPCSSVWQADYAARVLSVDRQLRPERAFARFEAINTRLCVALMASDLHTLRTSCSATFELIYMVVQTMEEMEPKEEHETQRA